jgi:hypothetical protein
MAVWEPIFNRLSPVNYGPGANEVKTATATELSK